MLKAVWGNPHGQSRFSRKCARLGIKINNSDDTIVLLNNGNNIRVTTTLSGDGNVKLRRNMTAIEVVIVLSVRRWCDGEHVSKCATVAKRLRKTNQTLGCMMCRFCSQDTSFFFKV